ncbi:methyltransferase domain-containing protein [filamentous cyanobacterium LEGE 11480]|uniref:Methyltransferase domain-containing protein n=1 Tax=Romeriopsis navalis LEGE 11480 TaxID=2777977 RepID=A0A928VQV2_9CYAN|nr:methyltransferase domain-containing protein [Romeriopsis navalis]MBE9032835.1 methyltransferase domain-containing protein [Romeriopsis navalis LEGE 11480]
MIETHQPNNNPQTLTQRLQAELERQQQADTSPAAPISLRVSTRQAQLAHIDLILDAATQKNQPRTVLPGKLDRLPIISHSKIKRLLLKVYNFLFKEQRAAQMNTIQALRQSTKLHQQMLEQTQALEEFQQNLHSNVSQQLARLDQRANDLENRLNITEQEVSKIKLPTNGVTILHSLRDRLNRLETSVQQLEHTQGERLRYLQADVSQTKRLMRQILNQDEIILNHAESTIERHNPLDGQQIDDFYSAFEDEFRGSREAINQRLRKYIPLIADANLPPLSKILDLGCGRGEWLEILNAEGYETIGIDLNDAMLEQCQAAGLNVVKVDALEYLKALPDNSITAITGFHIVEHLPFEILVSLMSEAFRVVQPGGFVLFETPNPRNVLVGSFSFYLDPTHRNPIPPEVLQFLTRYSGFEQVTPIWVNPSDRPKVVEDSELAKRFNELFYGFMDYAVMGLKG